MSQKQMWELFWVETPAVNKHLNNIFNGGELVQNSSISKMETVKIEWNRKVKREIYNNSEIISVYPFFIDEI